MARRCRSLGLTVALMAPDGKIAVPDSAPWVEHVITGSPMFSRQAAAHRPALAGCPGKAVEVWPDVWLVSLSNHQSEHCDESVFSGACPVAILLGQAFLESEWLTLLCDRNQLDRQAALARIDPARLLSAAETKRVTRLLGWMVQDLVDGDRQTTDLEVMGKQLGDSYEELNMLYRLSASLTTEHPEPCLFTQVCRELIRVVGFRWVAVQLTGRQARLNEWSGRLFVAGEPPCDPGQIQGVGRAFFVDPVLLQEPWVVDDTRESSVAGLADLAGNMLVIPLSFEGELIGILIGADKLDRPQISSIDVKLFSALGHSLSFYLQNTMLYEDTHAMFMGTMHALTKLIDAKDSYTYGHTERVALLAKQLAVRLGLDAQSVERVYIASLIHDVGKIGIPEAVLCKPGSLTQDEFNIIKQHPEIGARVLADIPQMRDLIPGVLYHHERWDGRGYPHQLAGQNIPLLGRIIALADAYDAMSSNRTYRHAMGHDQVLDEIRRCAGTQFDPELTQTFIELDFGPYSDLIRQHQLESRRNVA